MELEIKGVRVRVSFLFAGLIALYLILMPGAESAFFLLAITLHETGHLLVLAAFGKPPAAVELCPFGIRITRRGAIMPPLRELAALAAGPLANLLSAALFFLASSAAGLGELVLAARINLLVAAFNLIPAGSLDGGNMLRCLLERAFLPRTARAVGIAVGCAFLLPLLAVGAVLLVCSPHRPSLLVTALYLAVTLLKDT